MAQQYIDGACPKCKRSVRVRAEYLGKRIACKYCDHDFLAQAQLVHGAAAAEAAATAGSALSPELTIARQRVATLEEVVSRDRGSGGDRAPSDALG